MSHVGLDYLGSRAWIARDKPDGALSLQAESDNVPTALLPLKKTEALVCGANAESHRRGRGLEWPPEAQVPVLGIRENDAGRVLLAAAFEKLARAESSWGRLSDTRFTWRPDGIHAVDVESARLIAAQVLHRTEAGNTVGLVVPDALGVGGQTVLLSALQARKVMLVPRTIAAALAWSRSPEGTKLGAQASDEFAGYVTVIDLGFGRWHVAKVPLARQTIDGRRWLVPLHVPKLKKTNLRPSGMAVLLSERGEAETNVLTPGWKRAELLGQSSLDLRRTSERGVGTQLASLAVLSGEGDLAAAMEEIRSASRRITCENKHGRCLGVIVTGALARANAGGEPLATRLARMLGDRLLASAESTPAEGAVWAAQGMDSALPTWLEMVEQLQIYYIGKNDLGDIEPDWKEILPHQLIKAGTEYRSPSAIRGLKLEAGRSSLAITVRRPDDAGVFQYRRVESTRGRVSRTDTPVDISVVARPGQGFAIVRIESREPGVFESTLDWQKMEVCDEPKPPKLGYILRAVELRVSLDLWYAASSELKDLDDLLRGNASELPVLDQAKRSVQKLGKILSAEFVRDAPIGGESANVFVLYSPMGRHATPPGPMGVALLQHLAPRIEAWIARHPFAGKTNGWLRKHLGWWHLGCPKFVVKEVAQKMLDWPEDASEIDLHVAGLCFSSPKELARFYDAFLVAIPNTTRPNLWLKALRNIVKFNEHALAEISDETAYSLFEQTTVRLALAADLGKPIIAMNCAEALLFLLKRRRYDPAFAGTDSVLYRAAVGQIRACELNRVLQRKARLKETLTTFRKFLDVSAELSDVGTLLVDENEDSDDEG